MENEATVEEKKPIQHKYLIRHIIFAHCNSLGGDRLTIIGGGFFSEKEWYHSDFHQIIFTP